MVRIRKTWLLIAGLKVGIIFGTRWRLETSAREDVAHRWLNLSGVSMFESALETFQLHPYDPNQWFPCTYV